jgi:hypothetical protein
MINERPFTPVPTECPPHTCVQTFQLALIIQHEFLGRYAVLSRVRAKVSRDLSVTVIGPEDLRPLWPWVIRRTAGRRSGQEFEIRNRLGPVSHGGSDAVVSGVTASDNDDVLAPRADVAFVLEL